MSAADGPPPLVSRFPTLPVEAQQQLMAAQVASKKIRRAAAVGTFDAWSVAVFGGLSLLCGLSGGISGVVLGAAMGVIAYVEFTNVARLRRLDVKAASNLGYNQLAFAAALITYALWSLRSGGLLADLQAHSTELGEAGKDMEDLGQLITNVVYGSLIVIAVFVQGGTALYYFSRAKYVKEYVEQTPDWILEMQRTGGVV